MKIYKDSKARTQNDITRAIWTGDTETLHDLAPCVCCCDEHTFSSCPARQWFGCKGQPSDTEASADEWAEYYSKTRGLTREQFYRAD